jgi:DNA-binding transcriptional LysR family regulator
MEFRQLRYFLRLAECMHFTMAAESLDISQSALTQQIRALEKELGVVLLKRTNRRVQLTPAGAAFRTRVQEVLEKAAEAVTEARSIEIAEWGRISLGFVSMAAMIALPKVLVPFCARFPRIVVELQELDPEMQMEALLHDKIDAGFTSTSTSLPSLECTLIIRDKLIVALPERHPAAKRRTIDLMLLSQERFLMPPRHALGGVHETIINACRKAGFVPQYIHSIRLAEIAVCLVATGLGIALIPESLEKVKIDGVVYRPFEHNAPVIELYAIRRKDKASLLLDNLWTCIGEALQNSTSRLIETRIV